MSASMKRKFGAALLLSMCVCWGTFAQGPKKDPSRKAVQDSTKVKDASSSKEEANRNVMLNAASANGPREIQIGLPSADVKTVFRLLMLPILTVLTHNGVLMPA